MCGMEKGKITDNSRGRDAGRVKPYAGRRDTKRIECRATKRREPEAASSIRQKANRKQAKKLRNIHIRMCLRSMYLVVCACWRQRKVSRGSTDTKAKRKRIHKPKGRREEELRAKRRAGYLSRNVRGRRWGPKGWVTPTSKPKSTATRAAPSMRFRLCRRRCCVKTKGSSFCFCFLLPGS